MVIQSRTTKAQGHPMLKPMSKLTEAGWEQGKVLCKTHFIHVLQEMCETICEIIFQRV
jgi:hypothetical protein